MPDKDTEFLKKLVATFRIEADEYVKSMSAGLYELEKAPIAAHRAELIDTIFREAHSLKGAARAVNFTDIESACQSLETAFAGIKRGAVVSAELFELLHEVLDALTGLVAPTSTAAGRLVLSRLIRRLDRSINNPAAIPAEGSASPTEASVVPPSVASPQSPAVVGAVPETVRISTARLDATMRQTEELLAAKLSGAERVRELREFGAALVATRQERAASAGALRILDRAPGLPDRANGGGGATMQRHGLASLRERLQTSDLIFKTLEHRLSGLVKSAERDQRALSAMVDNLLRDVKEMQLLPLGSLLDALPRMVRELTRDRGKLAEMTIQGSEIEIDRRILEELKDPLIHLLRNCVDHGIELPELRKQHGKPPHGAIAISVSQRDGGKVEIAITDDGAGIDVARVKAAAGRLDEHAAEEVARLDDRQCLELVFRSGISTSPMITDLSGRGLGLAIVREKIEGLGGVISIATQVNEGTTFRIVLPLTLANFRGILVRVGDHLFVIPAVSTERAVRVAARDVQTVENRDTIPVGGQAVALVRLDRVLGMPRQEEAADTVEALVLGAGPGRIAFRVDAILGEQEVLVKSLGPQLTRVRNVAGACVLGTGQVAPVLNISDLMRSATLPEATARTPAAAAIPGETRRRAVLVVEDSITSRALLKNIMEAAGYSVTTAVDGIDAFTTLKSGSFDLIVSDVEMPRMNGFELTAKVRADRQLGEMPVVLVTALESREHRERGIEVGANAYVVKSSFDQSNLLEIVRRLVP